VAHGVAVVDTGNKGFAVELKLYQIIGFGTSDRASSMRTVTKERSFPSALMLLRRYQFNLCGAPEWRFRWSIPPAVFAADGFERSGW